jgi:hypothetical protein
MKYVPLKAELIEEGNFFQNINGALLKAQNQFITMARANKGKCKGMTAKVQATVTLNLESQDDDAFSIKSDIKVAVPVGPPKVTMAMAGDEEDGKPYLFVREQGSSFDTPQQGVLTPPPAAETVDQETGEVVTHTAKQ